MRWFVGGEDMGRVGGITGPDADVCCNLGCYRTAAGSALPFYSLACISDHKTCGLGNIQWQRGSAPLTAFCLKVTASCAGFAIFYAVLHSW